MLVSKTSAYLSSVFSITGPTPGYLRLSKLVCNQIPSTTTGTLRSRLVPAQKPLAPLHVRAPSEDERSLFAPIRHWHFETPSPPDAPLLPYLHISPSICPLPLDSRACPSKCTTELGPLQYEGRGDPSGRLLRLAFDTIVFLPSATVDVGLATDRNGRLFLRKRATRKLASSATVHDARLIAL